MVNYIIFFDFFSIIGLTIYIIIIRITIYIINIIVINKVIINTKCFILVIKS